MAFKNLDSPLYFRAALLAAQIERAGDYRHAAQTWSKAARYSRNPLNQVWSERRADFCLMQIEREKLKRSDDGPHVAKRYYHV
ncbi:ANR family transcriptional regulator [Acerihabitans sp. KWT182]|uniref:ANR family transcriptional regulator n=1 Tax=Acerihabitans sp. KWT182 TaxID=3157919 RepID=A0AAU7QCF1_9GAMM